MPIRPLVEITVAHPYFASGSFAGAGLVPDAATDTRLRGLRLVAKPRRGGLTVFADLDAAGAPKIPLPPHTRLTFELPRLPPDLAEATVLSAFEPGATFTDEGVAGGAEPLRLVVREARGRERLEKPAGPATLVLGGRPRAGTLAAAFIIVPPAGGATVTGYDEQANLIGLDGPAASLVLDYPVLPATSRDVLATIEIRIGPETVAPAAAGTPRRCVVGLEPVSARWCYHVVTNLPNPLAEWRIARGNGTGAGPAVSFSDGGRSEIAAADPGDAFGTELWRKSAPLRVLRFLSDAPAACSETIARRVGLFAGDAQLFAALPNPSPAQRRRVGGQEAFGEVLRVVTA